MVTPPRGVVWILFAAFIATAAKLYCALTTYGAEDVRLYLVYGKMIDLGSMARVLARVPAFNLTPLPAEYSAMLVELLGEDESWFPFLLKLPGILCYLGTVIAMTWLQQRIPKIPTWGLILFAASPVSFMIDGYHGNIDSVMVFPLILAACVCASSNPNWLVCAVLLALAAQVKVAALLTAPAFWFFWTYRGRAWHLLFVTVAVVLLGWLPGLLANPAAYLKNVVGYGSIWGLWGITYLFHISGRPEFQQMHWVGLSQPQLYVSQTLKLVIVVSVITVAWRNRKGDAATLFATIAFTWMIFFTFAPGMGMQYMLWFAPFLLVWSPRWYAVLTIVTSVVLFAYYQTASGTFPWYRTDSPSVVKYAAVLLVPWAAFLGCTIAFLTSRTNASEQLAAEGTMRSDAIGMEPGVASS